MVSLTKNSSFRTGLLLFHLQNTAMKNPILTVVPSALLFVAVFYVAGMSSAEEETKKFDGDLRVLCYNVHHCEGEDKKTDIERIADIILSQKPDVVFLQEIDNKAKRTGNVDQAKELERLTKLTAVFGKAIDLQGGEYGLAILTRFPVLENEMRFLPLTDADPEQRGVLRVLVDVSPTQKLTLLCTHLSHRGNTEKRLAQAQKINEFFGEMETPVILAGDFNATPNTDTYKAIAAKWSNVADNRKKAGEPTPHAIDFIFYRPEGAFSILETKTIDEPLASDHNPIFAIMRLEAK